MQSLDTASLVGTGVSIAAKFDLVKNNGAEFTCNISTGLSIIVDINIIVLIRSSINVEAPNFSNAVQIKGSTLTEVTIWDCLGDSEKRKHQKKKEIVSIYNQENP